MKISLKLADLSEVDKNKHRIRFQEFVNSPSKLAQNLEHLSWQSQYEAYLLKFHNLLFTTYSPSIAKILLMAIEKHKCHEWIMERILTGLYSADDILKMAMGKKQAPQWAEKLKVQYSVDTKGIQECLENLKS